MVEVLRATKREPLSLIDRNSLGEVWQYVLPIFVAFACVLSLLLTVQRAGILRTWSDTYSGAGSFLVESCDPVEQRGPDQWNCSGRLTIGSSVDRDPMLVTSLGALASDRPYVGQHLDVFFEKGDDATVYPVQYRLNELTRMYLSLLPRLLVFVGTLMWFAGWVATRRFDLEDYVARDTVRFPQRFSWQSRGVSWVGAAVVFLALNYLLTSRIIGSLDVL